MGRTKTFTDGGSLLPGDLNAMSDDYEFAYSTYKQLLHIGCQLGAPLTGTYLLAQGAALAVGSAASLDNCGFYFDPSDETANTRVTQLRVRAQAATNAVAPAVTFALGLYVVTGIAGASSDPSAITAVTVVPGSTVTFATPTASSQSFGNSGNFAAPTVGFYAFGIEVTGTTASDSNTAFLVDLQLCQV